MAAPRSAPAGLRASSHYRSPDVVPDGWAPDRPAEIDGLQPVGRRLGSQGPDQGFALRVAGRFRDRLHPGEGVSVDDAIRGCLGIALRRASMASRAPVVHDLTIAFTIWGFLDPNPPAELVVERRRLFAGVADVNHHYTEARVIVDLVPDSTLEASVAQVVSVYPAQWRQLTGIAGSR
ncbi:MAG: hypothetical protein EBR65_02390 [Actinobacteria bacterium]|nr:hypothetical protein [Actinomycetota bacterium]